MKEKRRRAATGFFYKSAVLLCAVLLFTFFFVSSFPSFAKSGGQDRQIIRAGISAYPGYAYQDSSGNVTGADAEYAYRIAQNANMSLEISLIDDAEDYFGALDSGKVDMLFDTLKTEERVNKYLFSEYEIGSSSMCVFVRQDDDRFEYGRVEQLKGKAFGTEAESSVTDIFLEWCKKRGFTPDIRDYGNAEEMDAALERGEIDAGIYGTETREGYKVIQLFSPTPYYVMFRKTDVSLKNQVDDAMSKILADDPLYEEKLFRKYGLTAKSETPVLTRQEMDYIASHGNLKVAVLKNDAPFYMETGKGTVKGVLPDMYREIGNLTGLNFTFVPYESQLDAVSAVKSGKTDILGMYSDGLVSAYHAGLRITRPYGSAETVMLTRAGTSRDMIRKIACKKRSINFLSGVIGTEMNAELVGYNNAEECFRALQDGKEDAAVFGLPSATYLMNQTNASAYSILPISSINMDMCGATAYGNDTLCSILDKVITTTSAHYDGIVASNTISDSSMHAFLSRIPIQGAVTLAAVLLALVIALVVSLVFVMRRQKERASVYAAKEETQREKLRLEEIARSAESRNRFFSNISHDMRTPLNAIIGFSGLASKEQVSKTVADYLEKIETSGKLLLDLINDTLTVSKIDSGKLKLNPEPVSLKEIFNSVTIPIREAAERKHLIFTADDSGMQDRMILADRLSLKKILLNMLANAVKYTPEGGKVDFIIKDESDCAEGTASAKIRVCDNGVGIAKEFLPHIYEPFVQEQMIGRESSGTGLGLAIVKQLVELMGGTIDVKSVKGKGTEFTLHLKFPLAETGKDSAGTSWDKNGINGGPVGKTEADFTGKRILLCEDNEMNQELACTILESRGMTVVTAKCGREGVEIFKAAGSGAFDAILMDIRMPVMNGYEAAQAIRALQQADARTIPIIAMSADAFEEDIRKCLDSGMNAHVAKPINPDLLFRVLKAGIG